MARLLIADNCRPVRHLLARLLRSAGHEVIEASDGRQALAYTTDHSFDAVLVDLYMPYMDGLEICQQLRQVSSVPILVTSTHSHPTIREQTLACGANAFLAKPIRPDRLLSWIDTVSRGGNYQNHAPVVRN